MAHNMWDLEAEQIGQAPGGEWLCPLPSALCPLSLLRTTAALPAAALAAAWSPACSFSPPCSFSNPFSSFSSQGVSVCPAGRAGLPVRAPQGHPQEFQAGETLPQTRPTQAASAGVQRRTLPHPRAHPMGANLSLRTQRPRERTCFIWG